MRLEVQTSTLCFSSRMIPSMSAGLVVNVVQEFFLSCNEIGTIVRPHNARSAMTGYKSLDSLDATTGVH